MWGFGGFVFFVFMCAQFVPLHYCLCVCVLVHVRHCFYVCRFQELGSTKFNVWWSSMCAISSFRWAIPCPWPSSLGVFYLLMCFSWSWAVYDVLAISCLLFLSMQDLDVLCVHNLALIWRSFMCVGSKRRNWWNPTSPLASSLGEQGLPSSLL
jgi:hypothetical protein